MEFVDPDLAKISGLASIQAELRQSKIPECDRIACYVKSLLLNYQVNFGKENIIGESSCLNFSCELKSMSHNLVTSNTEKVFGGFTKQ